MVREKFKVLILAAAIFIIIVLSIFQFTSKGQFNIQMKFDVPYEIGHNETSLSPRFISVNKDRITIYNDKNEVIDTTILKDKVKSYAIGNIGRQGDISTVFSKKTVETSPVSSQLVLLTGGRFSKYGSEVVIYSLDGEIKEIYREDFSRLKPWKVVLGDIDGDGIDEVSIGVYKKTPFHQVMAKRPFIYSYENNSLQPKWKGSRLSKPFTDYDFCDIDGDGIDEIVSIEILEDNNKVINTYKWEGFGLQGFLQSESFKDIKELRVIEGIVYVKVKEKGNSYIGKVKIEGNNIKIEGVK